MEQRQAVCAGKTPDVTEAEAIAAAVAARMEQLDEAFLVSLGAYCNAAQQQGNIALAGEHKAMMSCEPCQDAGLHLLSPISTVLSSI